MKLFLIYTGQGDLKKIKFMLVKNRMDSCQQKEQSKKQSTNGRQFKYVEIQRRKM